MSRLYKLFLLTLFLASGRGLWAQEELSLPDECNNPVSSPGVFGDFFEKTIRAGVIENGSVSQAYVQLFSVNKLRKYVSEKLPNPTEGDTVDRHIQAQICAFAAGKKNLTTTSVELHRHLQSIAPKLLKDVKKLTGQLQDQWKARENAIRKYEARQGLIDKAEDMADREMSSFLSGR